MFDYKATCIEFEKRTETERAETLKQTSEAALAGLKALAFAESENSAAAESDAFFAERPAKNEISDGANPVSERKGSSLKNDSLNDSPLRGSASFSGEEGVWGAARDGSSAAADGASSAEEGGSAENVDPLTAYAAFLIGSTAVDGGVNEREYLLMYPRLTHIFGTECNLSAVKNSYKRGLSGWKTLKKSVAAMQRLLFRMDDELKTETLLLTLCVLSPRGRVSLKDRVYLRALYKKA